MLTQKDIAEFKALWRQRFGENLSDDQARVEAESLIRLLYQTYRPITKAQLKELGLKDRADNPP